MAYDIIGDIHGQADKLHALLNELGYVIRDGAYRHPDRSALFVGDFIDRGKKQLESVMTVRRMVDARTAQAVMGKQHPEVPDIVEVVGATETGHQRPAQLYKVRDGFKFLD